MGADGEEGGIEPAGLHGLLDVLDLGVELERDAQIEDALDLGVQDLARQTVLGDAEAHHAAGEGAGLLDRHLVAQARQMIGGRESGRPGADHQHVLTRGGGGRCELPAELDRLIAQEALDRIDADRLVELAAVAGALAGVVADAAHHGRQRVVLGQGAPGRLVVAGLGMEEPALDVLARGTGVVAGRQPIDIDRAIGAPGPGLVGERGPDIECDCKWLFHYWTPASAGASTSPKRRILRSARA